MHIRFPKPRKQADTSYRRRSVAPEQLLECLLGIFGVRDRMSDGPLVSENLVIVTTLRFDE